MLTFNQLSVDEQETRLLELAKKSLSHWDIDGGLRLIKHRENAVYEVKTSRGERFALRLHREGYHSDQSLKSEFLWLEALRDFGIGVPTVIPDNDGNPFAHISVPSIPGDRQVDLLAWIDGEQIGSVDEGLDGDPQFIRKTYKTIGQVAAQMHNQATLWELPVGFERHAWDVEGLVGDTPFWGCFWKLSALTAQERNIVLTAQKVVRDQLIGYGQSRDTYSLIHADFVPENFLATDNKVQVIDFDDAGFGWHLFDLATALYFIQNDQGYDVARFALIEGYREFRSLPDGMIEQLPLFLAARSFTYLGWVHTRQHTETAEVLSPMLIELCCQTCRDLLNSQ